jgi:hypothetical protein
MSKAMANLLAFCSALFFGCIAGYATFTAPAWLLGASGEDMVMYGWLTMLPAVFVMALVTFGMFGLVRRMLGA